MRASCTSRGQHSGGGGTEYGGKTTKLRERAGDDRLTETRYDWHPAPWSRGLQGGRRGLQETAWQRCLRTPGKPALPLAAQTGSADPSATANRGAAYAQTAIREHHHVPAAPQSPQPAPEAAR
jgi:hypothetical protein